MTDQYNPSDKPYANGGHDKKRAYLAVAAVVIAAFIIGLGVFIFQQNKKLDEAMLRTEELMLENQQLELANQYEELNSSFQQHEGQVQLFHNDSIRAEYEAAKNKVEELTAELKRRDRLSSERIAQLQKEIATLRGIMKHYVEQIADLNQENQQLRTENQSLASKANRLESQVQSQTKVNQELTQRMELAEKLNVTAVSIQALKSNGKREKNITKAKQLAVSFTITQNNSTPVGRKSIFLRITSPEGNLLQGNGITFPYDNGRVEATAQKDIEYEGAEISGITIYWDNNTALNPGTYKVELFADNYRLCSLDFQLKK
ncbi:MAG: hypothetical protein K2F82_07105 [Muribaculaceae bacterium]|nr:hypothetical protein [Muribaculaceae bacterium]